MGLKKLLVTGAVLGLAGMMTNGAATAQPISNTPERVIVAPSGPIRQPFGETLKGGMQAQVVSIQRTVNYGDLDTSKPSDMARLERRIEFSARQVCRQLDAKYPPSVYVPISAEENCVGTASHEALMRARYDISRNGAPRYDREDSSGFEE